MVPNVDELVQRLRRPRVRDAALAAVLAILGLISLHTPPTVDHDFREADVVAVLIVVVTAASVALRSWWPVAALVVSLAGLVLVIRLEYSQGLAGLPSLVNLYAVASRRPIRVAFAWGLVTVVTVSAVLVTGPIEPTIANWIANALILVTGWSLGRGARSRRAQLASLEQRDHALAAADAAEVRARVIRGRAAVTQEVHDLVAHSLTEMTVQASAAKTLVLTAPDEAIAALNDVEATGRAALEEMRRLFRMLAEDEPWELAPQPGLIDLAALVEHEAVGGVDIVVEEEGEPVALSRGRQLAAYRVVEEVVRHGRARSWVGGLTVRLQWFPDELILTVSGCCAASTGRPTAVKGAQPSQRTSESMPFPSLFDRIAMYGGTVRSLTGPDDTRALTATLPLLDERRSP